MFQNCHAKFRRDGNKASLAVGTMTDPDLQMQHHAVSGLMNYPSNSGNQHMKRSGKKERSAMIFFITCIYSILPTFAEYSFFFVDSKHACN